MAFGDLKGGTGFTGSANSITNPFSATGSIAVNVGDLIYAVLGEQVNLTVTACGDNLHGGSTYTATQNGTDAGTSTGRAFWKRVSVAGTLTSVDFVATASSDNVSAVVAVFEGPFDSSPLDANPTNITSDITSPFTCPATGTLAQASEVVITWAVATGNTVWAATSPNLLGPQLATQSVLHTLIGYQTVSATTTISPEFTAASNPTDAVLGTSSFKQDLNLQKPNPLIYLPRRSAWALPGSLYKTSWRAARQSRTNQALISTSDLLITPRNIFYLKRKLLIHNRPQVSVSSPELPVLSIGLNKTIGNVTSSISASLVTDIVEVTRNPNPLRRFILPPFRLPLSVRGFSVEDRSAQLDNLIDNLSSNIELNVETEVIATPRDLFYLRRLVVKRNRQFFSTGASIVEAPVLTLQLNKELESIISNALFSVSGNLLTNSTLENLQLLAQGQVIDNILLNQLINNFSRNLQATISEEEIINLRDPFRLRRRVLQRDRQSFSFSQSVDLSALTLQLNVTINNITASASLVITSNFVLNTAIDNLQLLGQGQVIDRLSLDKLVDNFSSNLQTTVDTGFDFIQRDPFKLTRRILPRLRHSFNYNQIVANEIATFVCNADVSNLTSNITVSGVNFVGSNVLSIAVGKAQAKRRYLSYNTPLSTVIQSSDLLLNRTLDNLQLLAEVMAPSEVEFVLRDPIRLRHRPLWRNQYSVNYNQAVEANVNLQLNTTLSNLTPLLTVEVVNFVGNNLVTIAIGRTHLNRRNLSLSTPFSTIVQSSDFVLNETLDNLELLATLESEAEATLRNIFYLRRKPLARRRPLFINNLIIPEERVLVLNNTIDNILLSGNLQNVDNIQLNKSIDNLTGNLQATIDTEVVTVLRNIFYLRRRLLNRHRLSLSVNALVPEEFSFRLNETIDNVISSATFEVLRLVSNNFSTFVVGRVQPRHRFLSQSTPLFTVASNIVLSKTLDNITLNAQTQGIVNVVLNSLVNNIISNADIDVINNLNLNKILNYFQLSGEAITSEVGFVLRNPIRLRRRPLWRNIYLINYSQAVEGIVDLRLNKTLDNLSSLITVEVVNLVGNNFVTVAVGKVQPRRYALSQNTPLSTVIDSSTFVLDKTLDNITLNAQAKAIINVVLNDLISNIVSSADIDVINNLNLNQIISNLTLNATGISTTGFILNESIGEILPSAQITVIENLSLNQSVGSIVGTLQAVNEDHLRLNQTVTNLTPSASLTQGITSDVVVNATISNVTSSATFTAIYNDLNAVVNATIDPIGITARARRRASGGDNVAWWWRQYVAQHAARKLLEREITAYIISPVGVLKGEVVGVKEEKETKARNKTTLEAAEFSGFLLSAIGEIRAEVNCGNGAEINVNISTPEIKTEIFVGNIGEVNAPIILPLGLVRGSGSAKALSVASGRIISPNISVSGLGDIGYLIEGQIKSVIPTVRAECEVGVFGNSNKLISPLAEFESWVCSGVSVEGKVLVTLPVDIEVQASVGVSAEGKIFEELNATASTRLINGLIEEINITVPLISDMSLEMMNGVVCEGQIIAPLDINIYTNIFNGSNGNEIRVDSPVGFVKEINSISGIYGEISIKSPAAEIRSNTIVGICDEIKITVPTGKVIGEATLGPRLVLVSSQNIVSPIAKLDADVTHDPDDEDSLTAVLLLAA